MIFDACATRIAMTSTSSGHIQYIHTLTVEYTRLLAICMHEKTPTTEKSIKYLIQMDLDWIFDCSGNRCISSICCNMIYDYEAVQTTFKCNCVSTSAHDFIYLIFNLRFLAVLNSFGHGH